MVSNGISVMKSSGPSPSTSTPPVVVFALNAALPTLPPNAATVLAGAPPSVLVTDTRRVASERWSAASYTVSVGEYAPAAV